MTTFHELRDRAAERYDVPPPGTKTAADVAMSFDLEPDEAMDIVDRFRDNGGNGGFRGRVRETMERFVATHDDAVLGRLGDQLRTSTDEESVGDDLWRTFAAPESDLLCAGAQSYVEPIVSAGDDIGLETEVRDRLDGMYAGAATDLLEDYEEDIDRLGGLAGLLDEDISMDSFDRSLTWLRGKQANPHDDLATIRMDDLGDRFEQDIDGLMRTRTLAALDGQARERGADLYEEITGMRPDELDEDTLYGVRAWLLTEEEPYVAGEDSVVDKLEAVIEHGTDAPWELDVSSFPAKDRAPRYEQPVIDTMQDGIGSEQYDIDGEEIEVYVADALGSLRFGEAFRTCRSIEWDDPNIGTVNRAASISSATVYAETEDGSIVGRCNVSYLEDADGRGDLDRDLIYRGLDDAERNDALVDAMEEYIDSMRTAMGIPGDGEQYTLDRLQRHYEKEGEWIAPEYADKHLDGL